MGDSPWRASRIPVKKMKMSTMAYLSQLGDGDEQRRTTVSSAIIVEEFTPYVCRFQTTFDDDDDYDDDGGIVRDVHH